MNNSILNPPITSSPQSASSSIVSGTKKELVHSPERNETFLYKPNSDESSEMLSHSLSPLTEGLNIVPNSSIQAGNLLASNFENEHSKLNGYNYKNHNDVNNNISDIENPIRSNISHGNDMIPRPYNSSINTQTIPVWLRAQTNIYDAAISANLATAFHSKNMIPSAMDRLERSIRGYYTIGDAVGKARSSASLMALEIEAGRIINSLHWYLLI